jgi:hypothetical protein
MIDYYLKFASESEADKVLPSYEGPIDVIGTIYKPTGKIIKSAEGDHPEMVAIPGWHVNVRCEEDVVLEKYAVEVLTPYRVWA